MIGRAQWFKPYSIVSALSATGGNALIDNLKSLTEMVTKLNHCALELNGSALKIAQWLCIQGGLWVSSDLPQTGLIESDRPIKHTSYQHQTGSLIVPSGELNGYGIIAFNDIDNDDQWHCSQQIHCWCSQVCSMVLLSTDLKRL